MIAPAEIAASARWFPQLLDPVYDRVLLVERDEGDYREASFLDERSLRPERPRHVVDWAGLAAAFGADARRDVQYIFHIGHVGSTLVSRLLGEIESVLALREPLIVRTFDELLAERDRAEALWDPATLPARLGTMAALLSRSFRAEQRALIKATSFTSESAAHLVPAGSQALLLWAAPERYVATILAGENSRTELNVTAAARLRRLHARSEGRRWKLWEMSEGEKVAMAWACEMTSLTQAQDRLPPGAALWMDFDSFLAAPAQGLRGLAAFFGRPLDPTRAEALARHRLMGRYSKATEYEYSPQVREEVLAAARRDHADAVAEALRWLERAGRDCPAIARCLDGPPRAR